MKAREWLFYKDSNRKVFILSLTWYTAIILKMHFSGILHALQIDTGHTWCNRYALMPSDTITWTPLFRSLLDFLTQSSSGILQDQCVCFWSSILYHLMAPSTGYQLCEPPTEPQSVLTSNRRKGKRKENVKKSLISFYWFWPNYNIMPYGVYVMVLDLEKASGAKGKQMGDDKNGRLAPK